MNNYPAQDVYATNLQLNRGYPLRIPEPNKKLSEPYAKGGVQIGDVGYVDEYGEFQLLFNIGFSFLDDSPPVKPIPFKEPDNTGPERLYNNTVLMNGVERQPNESRCPRISVDIYKNLTWHYSKRDRIPIHYDIKCRRYTHCSIRRHPF